MYLYIYILLILITSQAFLVIVSKNSVTSVLYLIGAYILTSFLFLILGAEFLSIILVIIYVGAVSILFVFVIMMLNVRMVEVYNTIMNYIPIGLFIGCFFFGEILYMVYMDFGFSTLYMGGDYASNWIYEVQIKTNLHLIAEILYNELFYLVWMAGLLLLLAMVGAIALTIDVDARDIYVQQQKSYFKISRLETTLVFWGVGRRSKNNFL